MIEILSAEPSLLEKINTIATHYSRESQLEKAKEELNELMDELENAININGYVSLSGNTWSEVADVNIMTAQLIIQNHRKDTVIEQMRYKLDRQIERIRSERRVSDYQEMIHERILRTFLGGRS